MSIISSLFKTKSVSSYLGIDIGTGSIKIVELENVGGRPRLVTYGLVEVATNLAHDDAQSALEKTANILKDLLKRAHARSGAAIAALPNFSVFSSVISLPSLGQKEMAEAVQWEAKKFVPMPIENVVLDWKVLDAPAAAGATPPAEDKEKTVPAPASPDAEKKMTKILLTAAPKHLVGRYVSISKLAGLTLLSLETESFALARSLVGNDSAPVLVADVGSLTTDLTVVEGGVPVLLRSIDVGGQTVTRAIADSLGIDPERAEQFKRDVGMGPAVGGGDAGVGQIISQAFAAVINEMKYSLSLYQGQGSRKIEKILVTGGSAWLPSLPDFLGQSLGIKAYVANPWARLSYPKDLTEVLDALSPRMAVAVGLAMREIE